MLLQSISVVIAFIGTLRYERQDMYDLERAIKSGCRKPWIGCRM